MRRTVVALVTAVVLAAAPAAPAAAALTPAALTPALPAAAAPAPDSSPTPTPSPSPVASPTPVPSPSPTPAPRSRRFVEVNPSTVEAGLVVGIRASCPDNTRPAQVESRAFDGEVTVQPQFGFLTAAATVRTDLNAQRYRVTLDCPDTLLGASTSLEVVTDNRPSRGPATGFGGLAGDDDSGLLLGGGMAALLAGPVLGVVTLRRRRPA
jgi:hypothetical protein